MECNFEITTNLFRIQHPTPWKYSMQCPLGWAKLQRIQSIHCCAKNFFQLCKKYFSKYTLSVIYWKSFDCFIMRFHNLLLQVQYCSRRSHYRTLVIQITHFMGHFPSISANKICSILYFLIDLEQSKAMLCCNKQ